MDKALIAIYISVTSAFFALVTLIITIWRFTIEKQKFKLEIQKLNKDLRQVELIAYDANQQKEIVVYDGQKKNIEGDLSGGPYYAWDDKTKSFLTVMGQGKFTTKDGIIDIERYNTGGRYSIHLNSYNYGNVLQKIPIDKSISGKRILKVTCEVKMIGSKHTLSFLFKANNQNVFDHNNYEVFKDTWEKIELAFSIDTYDECFLRIDDIEVSKVPSSVQIRNLLLYEKIG